MSYPRPEKPLSEESLSDALTYFMTIYEPEEFSPLFLAIYPGRAQRILKTARRKARNAAGRWLVQRIKR